VSDCLQQVKISASSLVLRVALFFNQYIIVLAVQFRE